MYIVKSLWLHNSPPAIIWQAYLSFVFGSLNFCWPALCDLPLSSFNKFVTLEKIASKWSCRPFRSASLSSRLDCICIKLIHKIVKSFHFHPLAEFFTRRNTSSHLRRTRRLHPLLRSNKAFLNKSLLNFHLILSLFSLFRHLLSFSSPFCFALLYAPKLNLQTLYVFVFATQHLMLFL